jgi:amino acid transporter
VYSVISWAHIGQQQLRANWHPPSAAQSIHDIFNGVCIGMLGLTGFECELLCCLPFQPTDFRLGAPAYAGKMRPGQFPKVLRNLHYPAIVLNSVAALLCLAVLPIEQVLNADNALGTLAQKVGGHWLRILVSVDAVIVLCGGVMAGTWLRFSAGYQAK